MRFNANDANTGSLAISVFAKRLENKGFKLTSLESTYQDLVHGVDYKIEGHNKVFYGAHRHMAGKWQDYAMIRYSRASGADTDYHKLFQKDSNFRYSFSFGAIHDKMLIKTTTARSLRSWIFEKLDDPEHSHLDDYVEFPFGNHDSSFLCIPFDELSIVKEIV